MWQHSSVRLRPLARKILNSDYSPERAARGLAAGFFVAAFPLPGLQLPLSVFCAWLVKGHTGVAMLPQFLSSGGGLLPLACFQYWLGAIIWPGATANAALALAGVKRAVELWHWLAPFHSLAKFLAALAGLGTDCIGPLFLGVILTALALALSSYLLGLIAFTYLRIYNLKRRLALGQGTFPGRRLELPLPISSKAAEGKTKPALRLPAPIRATGLKLLVDGRQTFPEMLGCIAAARREVCLETYILCADAIGQRFGEALRLAASRGVAVRLLFDGFGSLGLPHEFVQSLLRAGVRVAIYRPFSQWRSGLSRLHRRDHRKILVVDGQIGFTGGLNIGADYASREDGGAGWRDTHVRVDGTVPCQKLLEIFEETWREAVESPRLATPIPNGAPSSAVERPAVNFTSTNAEVQVLSNREFFQRVRMRRAYLRAIRNAERYILIENAYFIPDRGIRRALCKAVKRGVAVAVAVAMHSDVPLVAMASRALYSELLAGGVRIYEYPISMLHSKVAVIDDLWAIVGSYNLDHRSLRHNLEAGLLTLNRPFATALRSQIMIDLSHCREVRRHAHETRPWNRALSEVLAYQLRYWL